MENSRTRILKTDSVKFFGALPFTIVKLAKTSQSNNLMLSNWNICIGWNQIYVFVLQKSRNEDLSTDLS